MTLPKHFSALRAEKQGESWQWQLTPVTTTPLAEGEVWLRVFLSTINYKDRLALRPGSKILRTSPITPGIDCLGEVVASRHLRWQEGDKLLLTGFGYGEKQDGGFAEYVKAHGDHCLPLPPGLSLQQAMTLGTAGLTAAAAIANLDDKQLLNSNTEAIAISGASGTVGGIATSILYHLGQPVTALLRHAAQEEAVKKLGAKDIFNLQALPKDEALLRSVLWKGAIDTLGGNVLSWLLTTVGQDGVVCAVGNAASAELQSSVYPFILRGISLVGIDSVNLSLEKRLRLWQKLTAEWRPLSYLQTRLPVIISLSDLANHFDNSDHLIQKQPVLIEMFANASQTVTETELHTITFSKKCSNHLSISGHLTGLNSPLFESALNTTVVIAQKPFTLDINKLSIDDNARDVVRRAIISLENRCSTVKLLDDRRVLYK
jgi:putative YhdH/YhfP family quinone oxidoreductase